MPTDSRASPCLEPDCKHRPRKRFGQNFLHDPAIVARIVALIAPGPDDRIVEIGPGQGAITVGLLSAAGQLDVIEIDRDLIAPLGARLAGRGVLRVHQADALRFDLGALPGASDPGLRVVGNLPYNISTPLLFRFLEQRDLILDLHLMLQKEVVDRMVAEPGSRVYGRLSVMVQSYCEAWQLLRIGPGAFRPAPKVDSALVRLRPYRTAPAALGGLGDARLHGRLVAAAFEQRRKTLRNSLRALVGATLLEEAGIDPGARAETLSVVDFARLARLACNRPAKP